MQRLLGVPVGTLAVVLVTVLVVALGFVGFLALRNRILLQMGLRNVTRRRARSALIVVGLMLATAIISSALVTGDTIAHSIRSTVLVALGNTDEMVTVQGAKPAGAVGGASGVSYFDQATAAAVAARAKTLPHVDAATPAVIEDVSVQDRTTRQNEPRVTLFAPSDMRGLGDITADGRVVRLGELGPGELYLNEHAAKELGARSGDRLVVLAGARLRAMTVRAVVGFHGAGTDASAALVPMSTAQDMLAKSSRVNHIIVSNSGGATGGVRYTDSVIADLNPILAAHRLEAHPLKQDDLKAADKAGNAFMSLFTTFGMFSISAGLLLIFLIFVMLAAERRGEMGISRAVGMQRRHLIETFLFEGVAYDLAAALVGVALGVGVAFAMVTVMAGALGGTDQGIERSVQLRSLVVAGCVGLLVTLVVVAASARRVSRLNIVTAIRNLADPPRPPRRRTSAYAALGIAVGALATMSGYSSGNASAFMLGVSLILISLATFARIAGVPPRPAYTAAGLALVAWWLLPSNVLRLMLPNLSMDFSIWVIGGLMVVLGTTWVIVYNADVLLSGVMAVFGRIRSAAPVLKTSIAYPLRSRFRTGITLAMFTLVVYTLVVGSATTNAFTGAFNNISSFGGGFDVVASSAPFAPVEDMSRAVRHAPGVRADDFRVVSAQSSLPVDAAQAGTGRKAETYVIRGLDDAFVNNTTYGFATMATGYHSARQVWQAVNRDPHLAVVDATVVPRRNNWGFGNAPLLRLTGMHIEDKSFRPIRVDVRDPQTGLRRAYSVIGVLKDTTPMMMAGISVSQRSLSDFAPRVRPTVYYFALRQGVDPGATAKAIESAFLANGMQADALRKLLADSVSMNKTMNRIVLGFMGLGLIVGIAALGVISARSVVERRQQIGVLRALGFQRRMVQASFLLESSFISLVAIVLGTALGLLTANNVIADAATQPTWGDISFAVPWVELVVVFVAVYAAALLTTYGPSRRAARVYPAEALRYQ